MFAELVARLGVTAFAVALWEPMSWLGWVMGEIDGTEAPRAFLIPSGIGCAALAVLAWVVPL